ncbi:hypothetical protein [uncultured Anaerococcus sp.]|uniref:hypothetical protein n=1 Tax=uncultured Anaerococcus sp. TaxID=293428 RepID=UPI00288A02D5|nr:hypothetical protein [uncultured Anaerococcus sp.]
MNKKKFDRLEFLTSLATALLLFILAYIQYIKGRTFFWLILLAGILMSANSYVKYKIYRKS